jgi:hypothetical protein
MVVMTMMVVVVVHVSLRVGDSSIGVVMGTSERTVGMQMFVALKILS